MMGGAPFDLCMAGVDDAVDHVVLVRQAHVLQPKAGDRRRLKPCHATRFELNCIDVVTTDEDACMYQRREKASMRALMAHIPGASRLSE
jgi:hypothetical protein